MACKRGGRTLVSSYIYIYQSLILAVLREMLVCITESCEKKKNQDTPVFFSFSFFFFSSPLLEDGYLTKETGAKIGRLLFFFLLLFFRLHVVVCLFFFLACFACFFFFFIVLLRALSSSSFFFSPPPPPFVFFFSIFLFSFGSLVHKRSGSEDVQTRALVFTSVSFFVCLFVNVLPLQTEVVREKNENSQCGKTH